MTPQELLDAVRMVSARVGPDCQLVLVRGRVGNIAIISANGEYVGFIDLNETAPDDQVTLVSAFLSGG